MRILITGGCGFVGSNLAVFLKKKIIGSKIFSLDNFSRKGSRINKGRLKKNNIENFNLNISSKKIQNLPKFDFIIDCCAEPAIEESIKNPNKVFNSNLVGTFNLLKKIRIDNTKLIFLSSSRVYSIKELNKISKNKNIKNKIRSKLKVDHSFSTNSPVSLYGFSKLASEMLIKEFNYMHNIKYIINRFGVIAGPWQFGKVDQGFVSLWVERHMNKKKLTYMGYGGHGNQVRDLIHIEDVCEIILKQIRKMNIIFNESFDIGGGLKNSISLKELTKKCQNLTKNRIKILKRTKTSIFDIPYFVTNNNKIKKMYNWFPKRNVNQIIFDIHTWLKENKKLLKGYF
jgi:CDP-paratose 2-epimerase